MLLLAIMPVACVEPFDFESESFESVLVVDVSLTNELKQQEVLLSRTFPLDTDGPNTESNGSVRIETQTGVTFTFSEVEPGKYLSDEAFAAELNTKYRLLINSGGTSYSTDFQKTPGSSNIEAVHVTRKEDSQGIDGIAITVDGFDPTGQSKYYKYNYIETYKIIAPDWRPFDLIVTGDVYPDCSVAIVDRSIDKKVCYSTVSSPDINLLNLTNLNESRVTDHQVRFIESNDFILSHRYSILVEQIVQNREAYFYFETLGNFAGEDNLFSQVQAGFIPTNILSDTNPDEKVLGFFEVTSVDRERIFFNYTDFFDGEPLPPFVTNCNPYNPPLFTMGMPPNCGELIQRLKQNEIVYWDKTNNASQPQEGNTVVLTPCGDCTVLGSSEVPEFWIE